MRISATKSKCKVCSIKHPTTTDSKSLLWISPSTSRSNLPVISSIWIVSSAISRASLPSAIVGTIWATLLISNSAKTRPRPTFQRSGPSARIWQPQTTRTSFAMGPTRHKSTITELALLTQPLWQWPPHQYRPLSISFTPTQTLRQMAASPTLSWPSLAATNLV